MTVILQSCELWILPQAEKGFLINDETRKFRKIMKMIHQKNLDNNYNFDNLEVFDLAILIQSSCVR